MTRLLPFFLLSLLLTGCAQPHKESVAPAPAGENLTGTRWKLVALQDTAQIAAGDNTPHLTLQAADTSGPRVSGFGGCNRFSGPYTLEGSHLKFGPLAATRMACADTMALEDKLFRVLDEVAQWKVSGGRLELLDSGGKTLAGFEAAQ